MPPELLPRSLFAWPFASFRYESVLRSLSEGSGPQISHIVGPLVAPDRDVMAAAVVRKQIETPRTPDERISAKVILVGLSMPCDPADRGGSEVATACVNRRRSAHPLCRASEQLTALDHDDHPNVAKPRRDKFDSVAAAHILRIGCCCDHRFQPVHSRALARLGTLRR